MIFEWTSGVNRFHATGLLLYPLETSTGIWNNLRHKNVYCLLWLYNNKRSKYVENCSKKSCALLLVKIIEKYLRCRSSRFQMFFKVNVLKKNLEPCNFIKETLQHQGVPVKVAKFLRTPFLQNTFGVCFWRWEFRI